MQAIFVKQIWNTIITRSSLEVVRAANVILSWADTQKNNFFY